MFFVQECVALSLCQEREMALCIFVLLAFRLADTTTSNPLDLHPLLGDKLLDNRVG